jgi:hypothetical protein
LVNQLSPKERINFICSIGTDFNEFSGEKSTIRLWKVLNKKFLKVNSDNKYEIDKRLIDSDDDVEQNKLLKDSEENLIYLINSFIQSKNDSKTLSTETENLRYFIYSYFSYVYDVNNNLEPGFEEKLKKLDMI